MKETLIYYNYLQFARLFCNFFHFFSYDIIKRKMCKPFIEFIDNGDDYQSPERKEVAEVLEIRLYCFEDGCNVYIKGNEGYNGMFTAETGQQVDLRNECFYCSKHVKNKKDA